VIGLRIFLVDAAGVRRTVDLALTVGTADSHDPTGPDAYGYWAYDHTDTSYPEAPTYQWIDINPGSGGQGTSVGLTDFGYEDDDSRTLDLPFPFRYYGQEFERVTICSNGWLSLGATYQVTFANYAMPCAFAPPNMVAGFWDDLRLSSSNPGLVYYWFDEENHRYVVAWDNVRRRVGWHTYDESFEIILYDPAYYPTPTGDGEILLQFEEVNNVDAEGMYCTVGIQNEDHTTGITFNYFNRRPTTAAALDEGLAVLFTTRGPDFSAAGARSGRQARLMLANAPNPWRTSTAIRYELPRPADMTLRVIDPAGRVVAVLARGAAPAGPQVAAWSGRGADGGLLPSGLYVIELEAGGARLTRSTVLIR
jgi:hypothetical protein